MLIFFHEYRQNPDNCAASAIDYNQLTELLSHNFTTNNFIHIYLLSFKYLPSFSKKKLDPTSIFIKVFSVIKMCKSDQIW